MRTRGFSSRNVAVLSAELVIVGKYIPNKACLQHSWDINPNYLFGIDEIVTKPTDLGHQRSFTEDTYWLLKGLYINSLGLILNCWHDLCEYTMR